MSNEIRPEILPMPARMEGLPVHRGFPVPFFVPTINGEPEPRAMDAGKWMRCYKQRLCWVCGNKLGRHLAFVLGPMCGVNRTTSEPPCHLECAQYSARCCPFLSRPHARRREADDVAQEMKENIAGFSIRRNPGVVLIWITESYEAYDDGKGRPLIEVGEPIELQWYCEGRPATREEVAHSVDTGLPELIQRGITERTPPERQPEALAFLNERHRWLEARYPAA